MFRKVTQNRHQHKKIGQNREYKVKMVTKESGKQVKMRETGQNAGKFRKIQDG